METDFRALSIAAQQSQPETGSSSVTLNGPDRSSGSGRGQRRRHRNKQDDNRQPPNESGAFSASHLPETDGAAMHQTDVNVTTVPRMRGRGRDKKGDVGDHTNHSRSAELPNSAPRAENPTDAPAVNTNIDAVVTSQQALPSKSKGRRRRRDRPSAPAARRDDAAPVDAVGAGAAEPSWTTYGDTVGRVGVVAPEALRPPLPARPTIAMERPSAGCPPLLHLSVAGGRRPRPSHPPSGIVPHARSRARAARPSCRPTQHLKIARAPHACLYT